MTAIIPPQVFTWDGEAMRPKSQRAADRYYVIGQDYRLVEEHERDANTHRHFFAALEEAWKNLPEDQAERFPSSEHLRKWALVKTGFCDKADVVCESPAEAKRTAVVARQLSEYAVITISGNVVTIFKPHSQAVRAMDPKTFAESKKAVLELVSSMVGVSARELQESAGRAA